MSETREKDLQKIRDARIIDLLYGEGGGAPQKETEKDEGIESLQEPLTLWRERQEEAAPPPEVRARVLEAAARGVSSNNRISWWRSFFLIPAKKPALGVALGLVVIFGLVLHFGVIKRQTGSSREARKQTPSTGRPTSPEKTLALLDEENSEKKEPLSATRKKEIEKENKAIQPVALEEAKKNAEIGTGEKKTDSKLAKKQTDKLAYKSPRKNENLLDGSFGSGKSRKLRTSSFASSDRYKRRERGGDDPESKKKTEKQKVLRPLAGGAKKPREGKGGVSRRVRREEASDYTNAIQLQRQSKHSQASKLFQKAYKNATTQGERDRVLLRWAKSELAKGNKKKAASLLSQIQSKKGWVGREVARIRQRISVAQEKTKRRKKKKSRKKAAPAESSARR